MKKAFTLLELMIVVIIVGVLAALAIPQFQGAVIKARLAEVYMAVDYWEKEIEMAKIFLLYCIPRNILGFILERL